MYIKDHRYVYSADNCLFAFVYLFYFIYTLLSAGNTFSSTSHSILSQSYNATVFYFDNISFLAYVLNQVFLPKESSVSHASYRAMVLTICFQLFKQQTILWRQSSWKKWNAWWCTTIRHATFISCSVKDKLISEISFWILFIFKRWNVLQIFIFNLDVRKVCLFTNKQDFFNIIAFKGFRAISEFVRANMGPCCWKFDRNMLLSISKQQK